VARGAREGSFLEKTRGTMWDGRRHGQVASQVAGAGVRPSHMAVGREHEKQRREMKTWAFL
jgi:hypothetical protein